MVDRDDEERRRAMMVAANAEANLGRLGRGFVTEDDEFVSRIEAARNTEQLIPEVMEGLAFMDGLPFGSYGYNLKARDESDYLRHKFTTREGAMDLPNCPNLEAAIRRSIGKRVRDIVREVGNRPDHRYTEALAQEVEQLVGTYNHYFARKELRKMFGEREDTAGFEEDAANLYNQTKGYGIPTTFDGWPAVFGVPQADRRGESIITPETEFGRHVDLATRAIVAAGCSDQELTRVHLPDELWPFVPGTNIRIPESIYATGFNPKTFYQWSFYGYSAAQGDMAAFWTAASIVSTWELTAGLGYAIDKKNDDRVGDHKFGAAPTLNALMAWTVWLPYRRGMYYGLKADNETFIPGKTRFAVRSGQPASINELFAKEDHGRVVPVPLCHDFLHETKAGRDTLWKLWWDQGISFSSRDFPWAQIADRPEQLGAQREEVHELGAFGSWLSRRNAAWAVVQDIRESATLSTGKMTDPDFFPKKLTKWDRIAKVDPDTPSERSPRAIYVRDLLLSHSQFSVDTIPAVKNDPDFFYRASFSQKEAFENGIVGSSETRGLNIRDFLQLAVSSTFIRPTDAEWILGKQQLNPGGVTK